MDLWALLIFILFLLFCRFAGSVKYRLKCLYMEGKSREADASLHEFLSTSTLLGKEFVGYGWSTDPLCVIGLEEPPL
jgi:hypothetical protein